jgi:hypothetical protein
MPRVENGDFFPATPCFSLLYFTISSFCSFFFHFIRLRFCLPIRYASSWKGAL